MSPEPCIVLIAIKPINIYLSARRSKSSSNPAIVLCQCCGGVVWWYGQVAMVGVAIVDDPGSRRINNPKLRPLQK